MKDQKFSIKDTTPIKKECFIGSPETIRAVCSKKISNINTSSKGKNLSTIQFKYWLAGLIDGDGSLLVSKKGYSSCEITVGRKELILLSSVKMYCGGSIKMRIKYNKYRWRLHNYKGVNMLLDFIDGKLMLAQRQSQYKNVCAFLGRTPLPSQPISIRNAWLTGFYEAKGYFHVNRTTLQCNITCAQKDRTLLLSIQHVMGGRIYYDKSWDGWLYSASSLADISNWVKYFSLFPLRSWKQVQLHRFKRVLLYKSRGVHLRGLAAGRSWKRFQQLLNEFHSSTKLYEKDML